MAPSSLRISRRRKGVPARDTLTAASQPVLDPSQTFKATMGKRTGDWQEEAWDMLDRVGELRYYVTWRAGSCSRTRLVASAIDEETGRPTGSIPDDDKVGERVKEIVRAVGGGPLGQSQLVKRATECLSVIGEVWIGVLQIVGGPVGGTWVAVTQDEVTSQGTDTFIELPDGTKHKLDLPTDVIFRIWFPRPRRAKEADSPVRSALDPLREIVRTTKTISNASKSRLIGNGVVFVPHDMSLPAEQGKPTSDKTDIDEKYITEIQGASAVAQLAEMLWDVAVAADDDENSMAALIPIFASVAGDQIKNVSHLKFDNTVTDIAITTRNDAITRLAMALDVSPERLLGLGGSSNHWTAWMIGDEDVQLHIAPAMETFCQGLNSMVVSKLLEAEGIDPTKYTLWYDASGLTADPDKKVEAEEAFTNGAITLEAYLAYKGLEADSGYDFSTLPGWQEWARDIVSRNPTLVGQYLPLLGPISDLKLGPPPPPAIEQHPHSEEDPNPDGSHQEPDTEDSSQDSGSAVIQGSGELALAERMLVTRALELAGKRRRGRSDLSRLQNVAMQDTHRYMPAVPPADVPALIRGWDSALVDETVLRMGIDTDRLRQRARDRIIRELTAPVIDAETL